MSTFEEFSRHLNQGPANTRSSLKNSYRSPRQQNQDYYNTSGQPLNLCHFAPQRSQNVQNLENQYNASGQKFNLDDFVRRGSQEFDDSRYNANESINPSDMIDGRPQDQQRPLRSYHASGRAFIISDFGNRTPMEVPANTRSCLKSPCQRARQLNQDYYNTSGQPLNLFHFAPQRSHNVQGLGQPYNTSGKTFNLEDFYRRGSQEFDDSPYDSDETIHPSEMADGRLAEQQRPLRSYHESGRAFNISDFGNRTPMEPYTTRTNFQDQYDRFGQNVSTSTPMMRVNANLCDRPNSDRHQGLRFDFSEDLPYQKQNLRDSRNANDPTFKEPTTIRSRMPSSFCTPQQSTKQLSECQNISQEQLVHCLQNGDFSQILPNKPISHQPKSPLFDTLVKDSYYPGAIEDAVNGQIDFNKVAFDSVFDSDDIPMQLEPENVPISLVEAFDMRIKYEQKLRKNGEEQYHERTNQATDEKEKGDEEPKETQEAATLWIHRDEIKMASAAEVDVAKNINGLSETGLTKALTSLFKAEKMNNYDKNVQLAEEAIRLAPPEDQEKAALKSTSSFKVDMQKDEIKANKTYNPIEIISYIGTTKPRESK